MDKADNIYFKNLNKIYRNVFETLNITDINPTTGLPNQKKYFNTIEINSKYNTYLNRGLPPSPIGSPGEDAMRAAVNPEIGDWLYFITVKPQDTRFTNSFSQFNIWANEFRANEKAGLFK
jgi:cell division protein YceG involved in septum cleavage